MTIRPTRSHLIILVAILAAAAYITALFPKQDFSVYYAAGRSLLAGRIDLYAPGFANPGVMDYRYPPVFVLLFLPFALLPFTASAFLWASCGMAAITAAFKKVSATAFERLQNDRVKLALFLAVLLTTKYLLIALKYQNVHLLVVAAIFISFCLLLNEKIALAALLLALAIAIKVFPIVLLPFFVIKRKWKFLGITACFTLMFFLVPSFYFGIDENIDLHEKWYSHVVNASEFYDLNGPLNLSVQGQTVRYLTTVSYEDRVLDKAYVNVNLAEIEPAGAALIGNLLAVVIGFATFVLLFIGERARRRHSLSGQNANDLTIYEFGFLICMMLLVGLRTNIIYFIALFVPLVALLNSFCNRRSAFLSVVIGIVFLATVVFPLFPGAKAQRLFLVLGIDTFAAVAVWSGLGWILLSKLFRNPV